MRALRLMLLMIEVVRGRGLNGSMCPSPNESKVEANIRWKFYQGDTKHVVLQSLPGNPQILRKESFLIDIRENGILSRIGKFFFPVAYK